MDDELRWYHVYIYPRPYESDKDVGFLLLHFKRGIYTDDKTPCVTNRFWNK